MQNMTSQQPYKCVNCGAFASALYRSYGPSVLKLTKCVKCGGIVDKYVEYDTVIVMIDLVLMSREAQRHVIYNTEFKSCWKLFIMLMMLETYGVWKNNSLFTLGVGAVCGLDVKQNNQTYYLSPESNLNLDEPWRSYCVAWTQHAQGEDNDLFIWEKDFYILFLSVFSGIAAFVTTTLLLMQLFSYFTSVNEVSLFITLKCISLWMCHELLATPNLVWGPAVGAGGVVAAALPALCGLRAAGLLYGVVYETNLIVTGAVVAASIAAKLGVTFVSTSYIRGFVS